MKQVKSVVPPTAKELFTLRFMILAGVSFMAFFLYGLLDSNIIGYAPLYWLLVTSIIFVCLAILHEWYHYFSIAVPKTPKRTKTYTVDIFTTFCAGEPYEMIVETLTAIQAIRYPHKTYLCDEADDAYLKDVCQKLGVVHVTRTDKRDAKAGNINNALKQSSGEICVVLDPDHVPFPNFLDPIVSHFDNPEIGFVQIVQAYKNIDGGYIAKGAAQQTFQFYGPMMMTMNKYGTVLAIGANCTFRRTALESIGGHAAGLAEDMNTAMHLHAQGWKSVYVPSVLARGLVPDTLSAYYKQQLKWSRGVFELWVTSYIKFFKKFTWRQKLHYGVIPLYYFSGLIFFINFLIPIVALFFDLNPLKVDLVNFGIIGFPLLAEVILIRHFVQRWVMEDKERGFHIVGGLLMIGTWWVFLLGMFYTIIRKNVPYIPTPKDGNETNNWPLNIPNLLVLVFSLAAIIYGLNTYWNLYTYVMATLAVINCFFMVFTIVISRQHDFRRFKEKYQLINLSVKKGHIAQGFLWRMRLKLYTGLRSAAMMLTVSIMCLTVFLVNAASSDTENLFDTLKKQMFLAGIFAPVSDNGLSSVKYVQNLQDKFQTRFDIISLYIPWGDTQKSGLPLKMIDSIYSNGSLPMITWEPWMSDFDRKPEDISEVEYKVFRKIKDGVYDDYINRFALAIKKINKPVYLRFAHEADNPFYPWSIQGTNTPQEFKMAWRYVHDIFRKKGVFNVIWVWNPWKPEAVNAYFPGKQYVDWIGVTNLNYGKLNPDGKWYSMEELYLPFHKNKVFCSGIPVMLAEMGTLKTEGPQNNWFSEAAQSIHTKFPEIKAVVLFHSNKDKNVPNGYMPNRYLDWTIDNAAWLAPLLSLKSAPEISAKRALTGLAPILANAPSGVDSSKMFIQTKGVNYSKGQTWYKNFHQFSKKELNQDLREIKKMGANTLKIYGPNAYDGQIIRTARQLNLKIHYGFWVDENDFINHREKLNEIESNILKKVNELKNDTTISSWNIGNSVLQKLELYYSKPNLLYQQSDYISWLRDLILEIKLADPKRMVTVEVEVAENLPELTELLNSRIPEIDSYGLILHEKSVGIEKIRKLQVPYFYSKVNPDRYIHDIPVNHTGVFIAEWQDQEVKNYVAFDGVKDLKRRNKQTYYHLRQSWIGAPAPINLPQVRILRPAATTFTNAKLKYNALVYLNDQWKIANESNGLEFEWYLVKTDKFGNGIYMENLGTGPNITIKIPNNPATYKLYLTTSNGKDATIVKADLNLPLSLQK
ncbi:MAG TPA: glycosyltransferase family 2 protein [Daejeonella sp.]|nr:glycosyltransferase family 2 protein [Daejeonella sp.]